MEHATRLLNAAVAFGLTALVSSALAQSATSFKATCQGIGMSPREAVGDREGHAITVSQSSCKYEGGGWDGGIAISTTIWEWDKDNAVLVTGNVVLRKPGTMAISLYTGGKEYINSVDGKVTGFGGSLSGVYKTATGSLTAVSGKPYHVTFRSIPGGQYVIEGAMD